MKTLWPSREASHHSTPPNGHDLLAWEQVAAELEVQKKEGSLDAQRMQRLTVELEKSKKLLPDAIRQAWCMVVTVSEANEIHTYKVNITDEPLFTVLKNDARSRLQETRITAESLLLDGPYNLWREGETVRRIKDLAGAFAQLPHLPKMLNATAILDTLVDGCVAGDFVLRLVRPDRTVRTWWRSRPDDEALKDSDWRWCWVPNRSAAQGWQGHWRRRQRSTSIAHLHALLPRGLPARPNRSSATLG